MRLNYGVRLTSRILNLALCIGLLALPGAAWGQGRPGPAFMRGADRLRLLANEKVQTELKLTDDQKSKIKALGDRVRNEFEGLRARVQNLSEADRGKLMAELQEKGKAVQKEVDDILQPEQKERALQIRIQLRGPSTLGDDDVALALKLSDDQKKQITSISEEAQREARSLFQGGGDQEANRQKFAELQKSAGDKMLAVLTDEQREQFKKLEGAKFDIPEELRGPFQRRQQ